MVFINLVKDAAIGKIGGLSLFPSAKKVIDGEHFHGRKFLAYFLKALVLVGLK